MSVVGFHPDNSTGDVLVRVKENRRLFDRVPDKKGQRIALDRRGHAEMQERTRRNEVNRSHSEHRGVRYVAEFPVRAYIKTSKGKKYRIMARAEDISTMGMRLIVKTGQQRRWMEDAKKVTLRFTIPPGCMPEGYEMRVKTKARVAHTKEIEGDRGQCGIEFNQSLVRRAYRKKGRTMRVVSLFSMILLVVAIVMMRWQTINYFQFNKVTYIYGMVTAAYLISRYIFGMLYKPTPVNEAYTPGVTIIIPCFNEEEWIQRTIHGCLNQEYPPENLEVIVVDDCSNDSSVEKIEAFLKSLDGDERRRNVRKRIHFVKQPQNKGKREAMAVGSRMAKHDLVVFVDSDSFLEPDAIIHLVQPFQDPKMGGVSGRTDVANTYTNFITRMQSVRYYISFRIMKAAEGYFDAVTCLSGPLSCYRKELLLEYADDWLNQKFLGQRATFGDDRSMTNFILRKHRAGYQDTAICSTIVPNTNKMFLKQQIRWKRSWLRESSIAATFMWKKEPMMALSFFFGFLIPILAPVIVLYNLAYVPIVFGFFPRTFLFGLFAMSMLMSMAQLRLRRSRIWLYGAVFCVYHLLILMWQMPYAWVTFWKSTWGTRMTPEDLAAMSTRARERYEKKVGTA